MTLPNSATIIDLPRFRDPRGNLSFLENSRQIPFDIARVYWIYDVPGDAQRDGHAFYTQSEIIIPLSGSFDVEITDATTTARVHLARSYHGLIIPPLTWRRLDNFSTNSVAMILSSTLYDPDDYIRDFQLYKTIINEN